jgi:hypothetical protein
MIFFTLIFTTAILRHYYYFSFRRHFAAAMPFATPMPDIFHAAAAFRVFTPCRTPSRHRFHAVICRRAADATSPPMRRHAAADSAARDKPPMATRRAAIPPRHIYRAFAHEAPAILSARHFADALLPPSSR